MMKTAKPQTEFKMLSEKRKGRVTGSSVGAILGVDPNRTRDDVMRAMVRSYCGAPEEVDEFLENTIFAYGKFHEDGARAEFEMETGLQVEPCGFFVHPEHDWLGASPDGLIGEHAVFECKCPWGKRGDATPVSFKPLVDQQHYYAQVQFEMACTGRKHAHFYQWAPNGAAHAFVSYDAAFVDQAIPVLRLFYEEYLRERAKPERHLEPKRQVIETEEARRLLEEYDDLADAIDRATERKKEVLSLLVAAAKERNSIVCGRSLTMVERQGSVSYANVVKDHCRGVDLEAYRGNPSVFWQVK